MHTNGWLITALVLESGALCAVIVVWIDQMKRSMKLMKSQNELLEDQRDLIEELLRTERENNKRYSDAFNQSIEGIKGV